MRYQIYTVLIISLVFVLFFASIYVFDNNGITNTGLFVMPIKPVPIKQIDVNILKNNAINTTLINSGRISNNLIRLKPDYNLFNIFTDNYIDLEGCKKAEAAKKPNSIIGCYDSEISPDIYNKGNTSVYYEFEGLKGCYTYSDTCDLNKNKNSFCKTNSMSYDLFKAKLDLVIVDKIKQIMYNKGLTTQQADAVIAAVKKQYGNYNQLYLLLTKEQLNESIFNNILNEVIGYKDFDCPLNKTCNFGICMENKIKNIDLNVGKIYSTAKSQDCINSIYFDICNNGKDDFNGEFNFIVSSNDQNIKIRYALENGTIAAGKCVTYSDDLKLNTMRFNMDLDKTYPVKITLDTDNEVKESNENNNSLTSNVYSGKYYTLDSTEKCDVWCFDSDETAPLNGYLEAGKVAYKFNDLVWTESDFCQNNGITLTENYCIRPQYKLDNGFFANPLGQKWNVDCRIVGQLQGFKSGKCVENKCVPTNDDFTSCFDNDSKNPSVKETDNASSVVYSTSDSSAKITVNDVCLKDATGANDDFTLVEQKCVQSDLFIGHDYYENYNYDCSQDGKICMGGKCVSSDIKPTCVDSDKGFDINMPGFVVYKTTYSILGIEKTFESSKLTDWCDQYGTILHEQTCDGEKDYSCFDQNMGCVDEPIPGTDLSGGKCEIPNPDLMQCSDSDKGLDYENFGYVTATNQFGKNISANDNCVDDNTLIEYYCENKEVKQKDYTCSPGTLCNNGKCQSTISKDKIYCKESDNKIDMDNPGYINSKNIFGEEMTNVDTCPTHTTLNEYYCDNNEAKSKEINCTLYGKECKESSLNTPFGQYTSGSCAIGNPALKKCNAPDENNLLKQSQGTYTDSFGEESYSYDYCSSDKAIAKAYCDGLELTNKTFDCPSGFGCDNGACKPQVNDKIICNALDWGVSITDIFGNINNYVNYCSGNIAIQRTCEINNSNNIKESEINCETTGKLCGYDTIDYNGVEYNTASCKVPDPNKITCIDSDTNSVDPTLTPGITIGTNSIGDTASFSDSCATDNSINEAFCSSQGPAQHSLSCPNNFVCLDHLLFTTDSGKMQEGAACKQKIDNPKIESCIDIDGSIDIFTPSVAYQKNSYGQIVDGQNDSCVSNTTIKEAYCSSDKNVLTITKECPQGYVCDNVSYNIPEFNVMDKAGACIKE